MMTVKMVVLVVNIIITVNVLRIGVERIVSMKRKDFSVQMMWKIVITMDNVILKQDIVFVRKDSLGLIVGFPGIMVNLV
jgi:hypothetical protein